MEIRLTLNFRSREWNLVGIYEVTLHNRHPTVNAGYLVCFQFSTKDLFPCFLPNALTLNVLYLHVASFLSTVYLRPPASLRLFPFPDCWVLWYIDISFYWFIPSLCFRLYSFLFSTPRYTFSCLTFRAITGCLILKPTPSTTMTLTILIFTDGAWWTHIHFMLINNLQLLGWSYLSYPDLHVTRVCFR